MIFCSSTTIVIFSTVRCICSFCSQCPWWLFEREFPRAMDKNRRTNCVASSFSWSHAFELFSLGLCERPAVQQKREYAGWTKKWVTAAISNVTKAMLKRLPRGGCMQSYRWRSQWSLSHLTTSSLVCKEKKSFHLMNKIMQTTPSYLFSFQSYRCLKSWHSF
jgi:hypothetical protein